MNLFKEMAEIEEKIKKLRYDIFDNPKIMHWEKANLFIELDKLKERRKVINRMRGVHV